MDQFAEIKAFVAKARRAERLETLGALLNETVGNLGFDFHALGHHVDLQLPPENAVRLIHYPEAWFERVLQRRYFVDDPILLMAQRSAMGFRWSDVPTMMSLSARQKAILVQAPKEGLGAGYTVPVHVPGEYSGSISFAVKTGRELPEKSLPSAQYVGVVAFEAARCIQLEATGNRPKRLMPLSPRQRDCVALVAQGFSDKEISEELGIKPFTVRDYVEDAMAQLGATKRTQMVVRALFQGEIAFGDVIKND